MKAGGNMANKQLIIDAPGEIKQKALGLLLCSAQEKNSEINRALKPYDISFLQSNILHILDYSPTGSLTVNQIKKFMVDDTPNVSRSLNKLMDKGYIVKERSLEDQRVVHIVITDSGREVHKKADIALENVFTLDISDEDAQTLYDILCKF